MNEEPNKLLLRLRDIEDWLGISKTQILQAVREGLVPYKKLRKGSRNLYLKEDIKRVFLEGYRMK